jgi:hypothetical protein
MLFCFATSQHGQDTFRAGEKYLGKREGGGAVAVWRKVHNWLYETFELDVEPEALPGFEDLVRLWRDKRGDRPVPAWGDFEFRDFKGWHGHITLAETIYDPFDFRYRLVGLEVAARIGKDYTGQLYTEMVKNGMDPFDDFEFYEMTSRKMLISRLSGDLRWVGQKHVSVTFVDFPLADSGDKATHVLSAML